MRLLLAASALGLVACTVAELPSQSDGSFAADTSTDAAGDTAADTGADADAGADTAPATDADTATDTDTATDADPADADATDAEPADPDLALDWTCTSGTLPLGTCDPATITNVPSTGAAHIAQPDAITYADTPPSSGNHRPSWARWGEYSYCPPQRWLHNLEHGGAALLYDPCADPSLVDALRTFAQTRPDDVDGNAFRWILTPYPGLPDAIAVVTWEWVYLAPCVDTVAIQQFLADHYRMAPEDVAVDGSYDTMWIAK